VISSDKAGLYNNADCVFSDVDTLDGACLKLIDFGRSIDMTLFPAGTTFNTNCYTEDFQCIEMKESRPWTTQVPDGPTLQPLTIKMSFSGVAAIFFLADFFRVTHNELDKRGTTRSLL